MEIFPELVQVRPRPVLPGPDHAVYAGVRRLLVVREDRLGDLVLTLPAIERLGAAYPDAVLGLLVRPELAPLASLFAPVDRVLDSGNRAAAIRSFAPDAAVCISRGPAAVCALRRAGVRRVTGTGRRWFSFLFDRRVSASRRAAVRHEAEHALDLAVRAGASPGPVRFPIEVPADARAAVEAWLAGNGIVSDPLVIHPGTAGSCPGWPGARWRRLAESLRREGLPVVITEGPADGRILAPFAGAGLPRFADELPALAALLAGARLVVSNSTGPIHLANALGRPTLALHAPWNSCGAERWGPYGAAGWALVVDHPAARRWSRRRRRRRGLALMDRLSVDTVQRAVLDLLAGARPRIAG